MNKRRYSTSSVLVYKHGLYGYRNICSPHACGVVIRATLLFDSDLRKAARANKKQQQQYVAPGPDEKDANVHFLPQKNSSELKFVLQFTVTFP